VTGKVRKIEMRERSAAMLADGSECYRD